MAVIIRNLGYTGSNETPDECHYTVRINQDEIATFVHARGDGLAVCLQKASEAVAAARDKQAARPTEFWTKRIREEPDAPYCGCKD
jgi:hypothetical protein